MQRGFKRTDYRIERKNKFVNLESFFAVDGNALSAAFSHSPAKDLPRRLEFFFRNHITHIMPQLVNKNPQKNQLRLSFLGSLLFFKKNGAYVQNKKAKSESQFRKRILVGALIGEAK